ncbi:MAG: hypothetical protein Q8L75_08940 [Acidobacteriota bacterium]|nr:hypothetical protein [Acidobacteriota bacterium]
MIDAVELNTASGHLVALGMPAAPYPLAGTAGDVMADVRRLGGFGIAAHPDSPRTSLGWTAWDVAVDGVEWINADSSWRDEAATALARAVLGYPVRPAGAVAWLIDRPVDLLTRWDAMGATRSVPALAAADAHARISLRDPGSDGDTSTWQLPVPGYEAVFRAFSNHVVLDEALTGVATPDATAVVGAITRGRVFTVIDALASPGGFVFTATAGGAVAHMGESVALDAGVNLRARVSGPPGTTLRLMRDGVVVHDSADADVSWSASGPGVYRVEAHVPGAPGTPPAPWVLSNPIYVGLPRPAVASSGPPAAPLSRIPARTAEAATEHGSGDLSELVDAQLADARARQLAGEQPIGWRFALSPGVPAGQFAAVQLPVAGGVSAFERVRFTVRSAAPLRAWLQLRAGPATERWGKTFYADDEPRVVELSLRDFLPIGATSTAAPPLARIDSLLFVVDTLNNRPGATGSLTLSDIVLVR